MSSQATVCHSHFKRRRGDFQDVSYTAGLRQLLRLYRQLSYRPIYNHQHWPPEFRPTTIWAQWTGLLPYLFCSAAVLIHVYPVWPHRYSAQRYTACWIERLPEWNRWRFYISSRNSPRGLLLMDCKLLLFLTYFPLKDQAPFSLYAPQRNPLQYA